MSCCNWDVLVAAAVVLAELRRSAWRRPIGSTCHPPIARTPISPVDSQRTRTRAATGSAGRREGCPSEPPPVFAKMSRGEIRVVYESGVTEINQAYETENPYFLRKIENLNMDIRFTRFFSTFETWFHQNPLSTPTPT